MKSGKCPKCNSTEVYLKENFMNLDGSSIIMSAFVRVSLNHYVCTNCGYVENYISEKYNCERISKKWKKVGGNSEQ